MRAFTPVLRLCFAAVCGQKGGSLPPTKARRAGSDFPVLHPAGESHLNMLPFSVPGAALSPAVRGTAGSDPFGGGFEVL